MKRLSCYFKRECGRSHPAWDYALIGIGLLIIGLVGKCSKDYISEKIFKPIKKEIYYSLPYKSPGTKNLEKYVE